MRMIGFDGYDIGPKVEGQEYKEVPEKAKEYWRKKLGLQKIEEVKDAR